MYGGKKLSSFELARGYRPSICGLPQFPVTSEILAAHEEQVARRAIHIFIRSHMTSSVSRDLLPPRTKVYYFRKITNRGEWQVGFVQKAEDHIVHVCVDKELRSKPSLIAYEDLRLAPESSLLQELDDIELGRNAFADAEEELPVHPSGQNDVFPEEASFAIPEEATNSTPVVSDHSIAPALPTGALVAQTDHDPTTDDLLSTETDRVIREQELWAEHPNSSALAAIQASTVKKFNRPSFDIGTPIPVKDVTKDIGDTAITGPSRLPASLESSKQEILRHIRDVVGDQPVSESKLQFAPRWILDKAIAKEKANYKDKDAYVSMAIRSLPRRSNVISSHHFFHVKTDGEEGRLKLKCRLVLHGNRDSDKDSVRTDSSTAQFGCIRLLLSVATIFQFAIASLDISGAYLQAGDLGRDIYMRPPKGWTSFIDEVWKIVKPAYGLVESGRLWQLCIEQWLSDYGFDTIPGMPQLFLLRCDSSRKILLLLAKVVDDLLMAGVRPALSNFHGAISQSFKIGRFVSVSNSTFIFNRLHITCNFTGDTHISMRQFMDKIDKLEISRSRRKQQESPATLEELRSLQALAGKLNYLGHGVLPQASLVASKLQKFVGNLRVKHLWQANAALFQLKRLEPSLLYKRPFRSFGDDSYLLTYSEASTGSSSYGQTGFLSGLLLPAGGSAIFHCIDWHSSKQSRISFSSIGSEILAAAESTDRSILLSDCISRVLSLSSPLPLVITVDSFGLYSTITTLHEGRDYRLRPTVARLRDSFESKEISVFQWIPGNVNIADALTKINPDAFVRLTAVLSSGNIPSEMFKSCKRSIGTMESSMWNRS